MHTTILTLQTQLEQAKERLKDVEEDIKKNTGRDLSLPRGFKRIVRTIPAEEGGGPPVKRRLSDIKGRLGDWVTETPPDRPPLDRFSRSVPAGGRLGVSRPLYQRNVINERVKAGVAGGERISAKKRLGEIEGGIGHAVTVFSRLSGPPKVVEDEEKDKVKVTSQVLVQELPSRKEVLAAQSTDKSGKERNKRMFGALMGTLQKFRQEENKLREKEEKKALVERKVEEAAEKEKEEAKRQRIELFTSRRQHQTHIRHIEFKIIKLKQLSDWELNKRKLLPFIETSCQPKIFYLPKKHNEKTSLLLKQHQANINKEIEKKRAEVESLIEASAVRPDDGLDDSMQEDDINKGLNDEDDSGKEIQQFVTQNDRRVILEEDNPRGPRSRRGSSDESSTSTDSSSGDENDNSDALEVRVKTEEAAKAEVVAKITASAMDNSTNAEDKSSETNVENWNEVQVKSESDQQQSDKENNASEKINDPVT